MVSPVAAQYYGQNGESRQLVVDKKIKAVPETGYYDNIDKSVKVFYENDVVEFSVLIKNSGDQALEEIKVVDELPAGLSLLFYPGDYDKDTNALGWLVEKLDAGESATYLIQARISGTTASEFDQTSQMTNKVEAWADDVADSDTASYFVGGKSVPETGDTSLMVKTLLVAMTVGVGTVLRKFARGY